MRGGVLRRYGGYSRPQILNNILRNNRSFYLAIDPTADPPTFVIVPQAGGAGLPPSSEPVPDPDQGVAARVAGPVVWPFDNVNGARIMDHNFLVTGSRYCPVNGNVCAPSDAGTFLAQYFNGPRAVTYQFQEFTALPTATSAFDEGGNWVRLRFGPLTLNDPATGLPFGNYHLAAGAAAINTAANSLLAFPVLNLDIDNQPRPDPVSRRLDIGADERQ